MPNSVLQSIILDWHFPTDFQDVFKFFSPKISRKIKLMLNTASLYIPNPSFTRLLVPWNRRLNKIKNCAYLLYGYIYYKNHVKIEIVPYIEKT